MKASCSSLLHLLVAAVVAVACGWPGLASAATTASAEELMDRGRFDEAESAIRALEEGGGAQSDLLRLRAVWYHHRGLYKESLAAYDGALAATSEPAAVAQLTKDRELIVSTIEATAKLAVYRTSDGHFEVYHDPIKDAPLLPFLDETLEGAYYELGYDFGYWPTEPVRVELFGRASVLAKVSTLSAEAIKTTSTIALCKYNKLMVTSPRGTAQGYGWRDTVSHEYVHYLVEHAVGHGIPIWLHEALAKYHEGRWSGARELPLLPSREELLGKRIAAKKIVTFEQMHPSMALLPSQEDAAMAYAEVYTVLEYLVGLHGRGVVRGLLSAFDRSRSVEASISEVTGEPFARFVSKWMAYLVARPRLDVPGDFDDEEVEIVGAMGEGSGDGAGDDFEKVSNVEARDLLKLGELLRARGQNDAALVEYQKANMLTGNTQPDLQNALAKLYLEAKQPAAALEALAEVARWYPGYYPTYLHRCRALLALSRAQEAVAACESAAGINPYDPAVMEGLRDAYGATAQPARSTWAAKMAAGL